MTAQEYYALFSRAMLEKKIVRYENSTSRDDYHTYAIRETPQGFIFFCLLETFFRTHKNLDSWFAGSLKSFHEFQFVQGATKETLHLTGQHYTLPTDYKEKFPPLEAADSNWKTAD